MEGGYRLLSSDILLLSSRQLLCRFSHFPMMIIRLVVGVYLTLYGFGSCSFRSFLVVGLDRRFRTCRSPCIMVWSGRFMNILYSRHWNELHRRNAQLCQDGKRKMVTQIMDQSFEGFPSYELPFGLFRTQQIRTCWHLKSWVWYYFFNKFPYPFQQDAKKQNDWWAIYRVNRAVWLALSTWDIWLYDSYWL